MLRNAFYSIVSIALCLIVGKCMQFLMPILPSSLYGMMVFTLLLHYRLLNAKRIQAFIEWAIANMAVCFIPAGVGIINHFELIRDHGIALVFIIFVTTFFLLTFVGLAFQRQLNQQA